MNNTRAKPLCVRFCFLNNPSVGGCFRGCETQGSSPELFLPAPAGRVPSSPPSASPPSRALPPEWSDAPRVCATIPVSSARDGPFYQAEAVAWPFHKRTQRVDLVLASVQMAIFHPKQNANGGGGGEKVRGNIVKN